jgi:hypothetical protein
MTEHLSAQGMPDPREGCRCFWCPNKTSTPPFGAYDALTTVENGLESYRPQSKGGQELKKQTIEHYKGHFLNTQIIIFMLLCYY